jgi:4-hydroxy-tetrahydrodipicolinate reductase
VSTGPTRIALFGAGGRMGRALVAAVSAGSDCEAVAAIVPAASAMVGEPVAADARLHYRCTLDPRIACDVVVDFSSTAGFDVALATAQARGVAFVSGTTGLADDQRAALDAAAERIPVLWASNFSIGVALLRRLAAVAAASLDVHFDVEIVEAHHARKIDAPSGTALTLGEAVAAARGGALANLACPARHGLTGPRSVGGIGFSSIRGGDIVGEHTVLFAGAGERLELTHRATDRAIFARGAVHAARWLAARAPGRYDIVDTLVAG